MTTQITIHEVLTGEIIVRDMNADEIANFEQIQTEAEAYKDAQTARQVARQAVLDKLGLTADEAAALLG